MKLYWYKKKDEKMNQGCKTGQAGFMAMGAHMLAIIFMGVILGILLPVTFNSIQTPLYRLFAGVVLFFL